MVSKIPRTPIAIAASGTTFSYSLIHVGVLTLSFGITRREQHNLYPQLG